MECLYLHVLNKIEWNIYRNGQQGAKVRQGRDWLIVQEETTI